jgi:hypothetical protein
LKQLAWYLFCTRRACGVAWGITTPRHIGLLPDKTSGYHAAGFSVGVETKTPTGAAGSLVRYPANRSEPGQSNQPVNQPAYNGMINNARNQNASRTAHRPRRYLWFDLSR